MKRFILVFCCLWLINLTPQAQNVLLSEQALAEQKTFTDLQEALQTPEQVYILELQDRDLRQFPAEILTLKNLQILYIASNKIDKLPENIDQLQNLQTLDLYFNDLSELPPAFANLKNLKVLDLGSNRFKSFPAEILALPALENLFLYNNRLQEIPENIKQITTLKQFRITNNRLKKLPENLSNLQNLEEIHAAHNQLKNLPTNFQNLNRLRWLDLDFNYFTAIPQNLPNTLENTYFWDRNFSESEKNSLNPETNWNFTRRYEGNLWALQGDIIYGNQGAGVALGLAKAYRKDFVMIATGASVEYFLNGVTGAKASVWFNGLIAVGVHALYYTDGQESTFGVRPEIGIGLHYFSLLYGFNIVGGKSDSKWNRSGVTFRMLLPIKPFHSPFK